LYGGSAGTFAYSWRVLDLHTHILPGIDDGARSLAEALELARAAESQGIMAMAATPHVRADYPTSPEKMEEAVASLREELRRADVAVEILHGGEMELAMVMSLDPDTVDRFTIAQGGRYLLVEFPYFGWPQALEGVVHSLRQRGITAILAHPERNPDIQAHPSSLIAVTELGALVQVTAASISGAFGRGARRAVAHLVEHRLVHLIASDVHRPGDRGTGLAAAAEMVGGGELGRYLTEEVPRAIGRGLPPPSSRNISEGRSTEEQSFEGPLRTA
jgi:protein-tyrosine phosphatase